MAGECDHRAAHLGDIFVCSRSRPRTTNHVFLVFPTRKPNAGVFSSLYVSIVFNPDMTNVRHVNPRHEFLLRFCSQTARVEAVFCGALSQSKAGQVIEIT
jgi:hypothetical protein